MLLKIPTAWLQLRYQRTRLIVALAGVVFAVVIIFMQLGLRDALFESSVRLYKSLNGDCFLISPRSSSLVAMDNFTERRLSQILAFDEVEFVSPVYLAFLQWKNIEIPEHWRNIFIIGFDLRQQIFNTPINPTDLAKLTIPDTVLFDRNSRSEYGPVVNTFERQRAIETEVRYYGNNRKIKVVGLFELGTSFGIDGSLLTNYLNFMRITGNNQKGLINLGVIKLKSGTVFEDFIRKVKPYLPKDVKLMSKQELIAWEKDYWNKGTAIGFIFSLGVVLGIVVGIVVVYQILYTNVSEHLPEYATLMAMGYRLKYLISVVLQQSLFIAILGYLPGILIAQLLYQFTQKATLLPIAMTLNRASWVFCFTLIMCFIAGTTAVKKLQGADPADIF
jgi:putative ABC transport system permease protein